MSTPSAGETPRQTNPSREFLPDGRMSCRPVARPGIGNIGSGVVAEGRTEALEAFGKTTGVSPALESNVVDRFFMAERHDPGPHRVGCCIPVRAAP